MPARIRNGRATVRAIAVAGALYFLSVFAAGFALGTLRVLVLVPAVGDLVAVAIELPLMLGLAWLVCRWLTRDRADLSDAGARLGMGAFAFALLIGAETVLAALLFATAPADYLASLSTPVGLTGLAGQIGFGLIPWIERVTGRSTGSRG